MITLITIVQARGTVHYQHQNVFDSQKSTSTINAHINIST